MSEAERKDFGGYEQGRQRGSNAKEGVEELSEEAELYPTTELAGDSEYSIVLCDLSAKCS